MRKSQFLSFCFTCVLCTLLLPNVLPSSGKDPAQKNTPIKGESLADKEEMLLALTLDNIKILNQKELEEARALLRENKALKFGKIFNFLFSRMNFWNELDIKDIALFHIGPTYTAVRKTGNLLRDSQKLVAEWRDISPRERKALVKYETFLGKYPHSECAPAIKKKLLRLKNKKKRHDYIREIKQGKEALQAKDFPSAKRHFQTALKLLPASHKEVARNLDELAQLETEYRARRKALDMVKPGSEIFLSPAEKDNYERLLVSLTKHDANTLLSASKEFVEKHKKTPLRDEAEISSALAYEFKNNLPEAKKHFVQVGEKYPQTNMGKYARKITANPHYDLYASIKKTMKNREKESIKYILMGENSNLSLPQEGVTGWAKEAYNFKEKKEQFSSPNRLLSRTFEVFVQKKDPTNKNIVSLGEAYLQKYPHSKQAPEVRKIVAQAYEKEKRYNEALFHYNLIGNVASTKLKELEDKAAIDLLQGATEDKKHLYYANILELYPRSDAANLIKKYANNMKANGVIGQKERVIGINFEMFPNSPGVMSLLGGNSWVTMGKGNDPLPAYQALLGLNLNFGHNSDTSSKKNNTPKFLGLPLILKREWGKQDEYSMGYQLWDEKHFAVGKLSLDRWGTEAQMGINKKGPLSQVHIPIPVIKNFIPLALKVRANLGRVQFLPVMEDSELDDTALYQD